MIDRHLKSNKGCKNGIFYALIYIINHIISCKFHVNSLSQLRVCRIGALIMARFNISNACSPSMLMMKSFSLQRRVIIEALEWSWDL